MEYKFHENNDLSQWLDDRLREFLIIDTSIYNKLDHMRFDNLIPFIIKCVPTSSRIATRESPRKPTLPNMLTRGNTFPNQRMLRKENLHDLVPG